VRYCHKRTNVFTYSNIYSCMILIKLEFSQHIFEKFSNIKFKENPSTGCQVVPYRTDSTKLIVAFEILGTNPKKQKTPYSGQPSTDRKVCCQRSKHVIVLIVIKIMKIKIHKSIYTCRCGTRVTITPL
jgi:hypothetical protein